MKFANHSKRLIAQLKTENVEAAAAVEGFLDLDRVARKLHLLDANESFANDLTWMPVISILGTFSAGKSTFINSYLGEAIQRTGNQAVDDKFTVIMHSADSESRVLPGTALNSDPRFPMFNITKALEAIDSGEGDRVNTYLQLKTSTSAKAQGKILIDSPGFDADNERDAILMLADRVIEISDLVLVLFDARHPEPGAMRSTLARLVTATKDRQDNDKMLFILNQIDTTAREDNPEEVFAAWQRAIADAGLRHGRFYRIYDDSAAVPIEDDERRSRFEAKRDEDLAEIQLRIDQVSVDRAYRIAARLESAVNRLRKELMRTVTARRDYFWRRIRLFDYTLLLVAAVLLAVWYLQSGWSLHQNRMAWVIAHPYLSTAIALVTVTAIGFLRLMVVKLVSRWARAKSAASDLTASENRMVARSVAANTTFFASLLRQHPRGWTRGTQKQLDKIADRTDQLREQLNDRFAKT